MVEPHELARFLLPALLRSGALTLAERTPFVTFSGRLARLLSLGDDPSRLHEEIFQLEAVTDLEIEVDALGEIIVALGAALEAPVGARVRLGEGGAEIDAPPGWYPRLEQVTPLRDERCDALGCRVVVLPGERRAAVVVDEAGATRWAPRGAVDLRFVGASPAPDGATRATSILALFEGALERRAWPSLELEERVSIAGPDELFYALWTSPSERLAAATWATWGGELSGVFVARLAALKGGKPNRGEAHSHLVGPVIFDREERAYMTTAFDPAWPTLTAAAGEQVSFGTLVVKAIDTFRGCYWAIYGAPAVGGAWDGMAHPPELVETNRVRQALPGGDAFEVSYDDVLRPPPVEKPKAFPEVVKHRVRPRARSEAEEALGDLGEPFCAAWWEDTRSAVVATQSEISLREVPSGAVLARAPAWFYGGTPSEIVACRALAHATVIWNDADTFGAGVEVFTIADDRPHQLIGRGQQFALTIPHMQPTLFAHAAYAVEAGLLVWTEAVGAFWYAPGVTAKMRPMCGFATVVDVRDDTHPGGRSVFNVGDGFDAWDPEAADDPDRPRSLTILSAEEGEVELSTGERVPLRLREIVARGQARPYPCRNDLQSVLAAEPLATEARTRVELASRGPLERPFAVPGGPAYALVNSWDVHPSGELMILNFAASVGNEELTCGVFSTRTGALLARHEGAIAMRFAAGPPRLRRGRDADVLILTRDALLWWTLPARERGAFPLSLDGAVGTDLVVSPDGSLAAVSTTDPNSGTVSVRAVAIKPGWGLQHVGPRVSNADVVTGAAFTPSGAHWVGLAAADPAVGAGIGKLLVMRTGEGSPSNRWTSRTIEIPCRPEEQAALQRSGEVARLTRVEDHRVRVEAPGVAPRWVLLDDDDVGVRA